MHKVRSSSPTTRNFTSTARSKLLQSRRTKIVQFRIYNEHINNFKRLVDKPMDCVINAMQIIGMIDNNTAELLRIMLGRRGFVKTEIEKIFTLYLPHIFKFESMDYNKWVDEIRKTLIPGNVIFAGYSGHVFLIGKMMDDRIVMIDPQLPKGDQVCYLEYSKCEAYIANKTNYYILKATVSELSHDERMKVIKS